MIRPTFALLLLFADCGGYPFREDRPEPELRRLPSERLPERSYTVTHQRSPEATACLA